MNYQKYTLATLRIFLGWMFLWAFLDKTFGLGFSTSPDKSWLNGNSPTIGFLQFGTSGPLKDLFQSLVGSIVVDYLFMIGMLGIGLALILGLASKIATYSGALLMLLIYLASLPVENNPFLDQHLIYIIALFSLKSLDAQNFFGLGKWWSDTQLVKKYPFLK